MLTQLLAELPIDHGGPFLDAGTGRLRVRQVSQPLVAASAQPVAHLERNGSRAAAAKRALGERIALYDDQIDTFFAGDSYAFAYVDVLPRRLPELFGSLFPAAASLVRRGGVLALTIPDATSVAVAASEADRRGFAEAQALFGSAGALARSVVEGVDGLRLIAEVPGVNTPVPGWRYVTLLLHVDADWSTLSFPEALRTRRQFDFEAYRAFLERLVGRAQFVRSAAFLDALATGRDSEGGRGLHFVKHDIHKDLLNTYRMARLEADLGVVGAYFVMHEHELSAHYHDRRELLEVLAAIQAFGHEVGIHVDALDLVCGSKQSLSAQLRPFVDRLRGHGIDVRLGNTHGNTARRDMGFTSGTHIFEEVAGSLPTEGLGVEARRLAGSVSLKGLMADLDLDGWFDTSIFGRQGRLPNTHLMVGDNYRRLSLYDLRNDGTNTSTTLLEGEPWELDATVTRAVAERVAQTSCLYLFHPQFYR